MNYITAFQEALVGEEGSDVMEDVQEEIVENSALTSEHRFDDHGSSKRHLPASNSSENVATKKLKTETSR